MEANETEVVVEPEAVLTEVVEQTESEVQPEAQAEETNDAPKVDDEEKKAKRRSFTERINQITRRAYEAEEREREAVRKYNTLVQEIQTKPIQRESFHDEEAYAAAVTKQRVKLGVLEVQAEEAIQGKHGVGVQQSQALRDAWSAAIADVAETIPDWHTVVSTSKSPTTPVMDETIMESENGPEVAYYLAKHPGEALRISLLSEKAQVREIVRLESKVSSIAPTTKPSAPAPIKPIASTAKAVVNPADDYRQWEAAQNKRLGYI